MSRSRNQTPPDERIICNKAFKEILASQLVAILAGLGAGILLAFYTKHLLLLPGMLIIIPGFLALRGNITGPLAARISSGLFLGVINPRTIETKIVKENTLASFFLTIVVCLILGVTAYLLTALLFDASVPVLLLIPLIAGILANAISIPLTLFFTFYFFRKGHDPNNIMGPFVTSTGDVISTLALFITLMIL